MAEFTITADRYHVHATDGRRTEEYDIEAATASEAIDEAKLRWAGRSVVPSVADLPMPPEVAPAAPEEPVDAVDTESGAPAA